MVQKLSPLRVFFWLDFEVFSQELNGRSSPLSALERWSFAQPAAGAVGEEGLPGVAAAVGQQYSVVNAFVDRLELLQKDQSGSMVALFYLK